MRLTRGPTEWKLSGPGGPLGEYDTLEEALAQARLLGETEVLLVDGESRTWLKL
jgi:hypothetical protein